MKETELKSLVDEETYTRLKRGINWERVFEQENIYYTDERGELRENRITVRIRVIDGVGKIQVKKHKNGPSALQVCEEEEFDADGVPETIDAQTAKKITGMDVGVLYRMGSAVTKRRTVKRGDSELCLDKTTYFGKTDYEVELEYEGQMSAELFLKLVSFGVKFDRKSVGKFSRFLKEYKKQKGR